MLPIGNTNIQENTKDSKCENGLTLQNDKHLLASTGLKRKKKGKWGEYKNILTKQPSCRLFSHHYLLVRILILVCIHGLISGF